MLIEEWLQSFVRSKVELTTLLGAPPTTRFYPQLLPQNPVLPAATYDVIVSNEIGSHDGPSGLAITQIQLTIFTKTYLEAANIMRVFTVLLCGYRGLDDALRIDGITCEPIYTARDPDTQVHRRFRDIIVSHEVQ